MGMTGGAADRPTGVGELPAERAGEGVLRYGARSGSVDQSPVGGSRSPTGPGCPGPRRPKAQSPPCGAGCSASFGELPGLHAATLHPFAHRLLQALRNAVHEVLAIGTWPSMVSTSARLTLSKSAWPSAPGPVNR